MTKKTNDVGSTERLAMSVLVRHFVLRKAYFKKESSVSLLLYKQQESPVSTTTSQGIVKSQDKRFHSSLTSLIKLYLTISG